VGHQALEPAQLVIERRPCRGIGVGKTRLPTSASILDVAVLRIARHYAAPFDGLDPSRKIATPFQLFWRAIRRRTRHCASNVRETLVRRLQFLQASDIGTRFVLCAGTGEENRGC
jgi:hypothetical protein